jgi:16S rRNA processing protein RimM
MYAQDHVYLGRIVKKHSFKGEVVVKCEPEFAYFLNELESVWLSIDNRLIPFFIEKVLPTGKNFFRIKFEGTDSELEADKIIGKEVYIPRDWLPETDDETIFKHELIGFQVQDKKHGSLGNIIYVNDQSPQILLEIEAPEKTIMIPFVEAFIKDIDKQRKTIYVELPKGLVDL